MQIKQIAADAAAELTDCLSRLDEAELEALEAKVKSAHRVFVAGTGRSLLMIRGFAMRLMHAGLDVSVVGETTTPAIEPDDLLVIASGSGSTSTLVAIARRCKDAGAPLALITTRPDSPIGNLADGIVTIPAVSG
ncbi:MAG: SIS domain-containing protein, partial [Atopobiaceae bacterium]|nr:SIS domain-containing protein [Atopobiaceae bacterium]